MDIHICQIANWILQIVWFIIWQLRINKAINRERLCGPPNLPIPEESLRSLLLIYKAWGFLPKDLNTHVFLYQAAFICLSLPVPSLWMNLGFPGRKKKRFNIFWGPVSRLGSSKHAHTHTHTHIYTHTHTHMGNWAFWLLFFFIFFPCSHHHKVKHRFTAAIEETGF